MNTLMRKFRLLVPFDLRALYFTFKYRRQIANLQIADCGMRPDGKAYVRLQDGPTFVGHRAHLGYRLYYYLFAGPRTRAKLTPETCGVAFDICMRYLGPSSQEEQLRAGRFHNLQPGSIVMEVGAYIGYYAMQAAKLVQPDGHVIAVEAVPENVKIINENLRINEVDNITVVEAAAWKEPADLTFYRESHQAGSLLPNIVKNKTKFTVSANSIDNILKELNVVSVDFIRIQVNGAEMEVLQGMRETMEKRHPIVLVTAPYLAEDPACGQMTSYIKQFGYKVTRHGDNIFAH